MTKTYTITTNDTTTTTYTVRDCTAVAVSIGETERTTALYVDYYDDSGEHVEYVVFNATMPEDEDEFMILCDYSDEWDSNYRTIATVCFEEGVNIDERVNDAAERIRNARSLSECDDAVATICESAGMLHDLIDASDETVVLLKAANLLGVDVRGPWGADHEIWEDNAGEEYNMNIYRIYEYKACVKIPRGMHNNNGAYTAEEVETIVMEDAYKGDCFLHDNPIYTTKSKAEAEAKFEELKSKTSAEVGYQWITKTEALYVTCYGMEELTYNVAYWGEPEDDDELLERAESVGENWTFAGVEESEDE